MATLQLFFFATDETGVATGVMRSTGSFSFEHDEAGVLGWIEASKARAERMDPNVRFGGLYSAASGQVLLTQDLVGCAQGFRETAKSDLVERYALGLGLRPRIRVKSLAKLEKDLDDQGIALWYDDDVPVGAEDQFDLYTLIYLDHDDDEVVCISVHLHEQTSAALARMLADEPYGRWEPLALMRGDVEPLILPEELDHGPVAVVPAPRERMGGEVDVTRPKAVPQAPVQMQPAPPRKPPSQVLAEILTREAVARMKLDRKAEFKDHFKNGDDPFTVFMEVMRDRRPLVVIETQYWEIADAVGRFMAASLGLEFIAAGAREGYRASNGRGRGRLIYFDDSLFNNDYQIDRNSVRALVKELATGNDVGLIVVGNKRTIPQVFQSYTDFELQLPPIVGQVREDIFAAILGPEAARTKDADKWARYLLPFDFEKVLATGLSGAAAVEELKARVDRRLSRKAAETAPDLEEIHGLGEAKELALQLVGDIRQAVAGELDWSEVDRGMLLVGPPGTGKTMLAKAISKESGIRFVAGSALEWQSSGALDQHLARIREFFAEARRYAPTIVFIDEFDAIGNRQHHQGRNDYYTTAVVNCVLEELQGFQDREGVIVIGATNEPNKIDPALKRAGRLDQQVTINRPNVHELAKIYEYHIALLGDKGQVAGDINTEELAKLTFGQTGADVEFYVRGARRRARKDRRKTAQRDFVAEIMRRPIGPSGLDRMTKDEIYRTAVHEAGHALAQLLGPSKGKDISYVSIIPRPDGTLGFVATFNDRVDIQRAEVMEFLRVFLAGRAAEHVIYGRRHIGAGSGGGARSDLAQATRLLTRMYLQYGYSKTDGLLWRDADRMEFNSAELPWRVKWEVRRSLGRAYRQTVRQFRRNRGMLKRIAKTLLDHQEMTGEELRAMYRSYRLGPIGLLGNVIRRIRSE